MVFSFTRKPYTPFFVFFRFLLTYVKNVATFFYITVQRDGHAELVSASHCEPLLTPLLSSVRSWNKLTFVQFAHALHSQTSLALLSLNRKFQDDFWRFLLFLHSFWGSQFNTYEKQPHCCLADAACSLWWIGVKGMFFGQSIISVFPYTCDIPET